jgi:hypothetical protein
VGTVVVVAPGLGVDEAGAQYILTGASAGYPPGNAADPGDIAGQAVTTEAPTFTPSSSSSTSTSSGGGSTLSQDIGAATGIVGALLPLGSTIYGTLRGKPAAQAPAVSTPMSTTTKVLLGVGALGVVGGALYLSRGSSRRRNPCHSRRRRRNGY